MMSLIYLTRDRRETHGWIGIMETVWGYQDTIYWGYHIMWRISEERYTQNNQHTHCVDRLDGTTVNS